LKNFIITTILFLTCLFPINAAEITIGEIYSTDIVAYIDESPIQSYNIGGRTAVIVEDLKDYGFDVKWDDSKRELTVTTLSEFESQTKTITNKSNTPPGTPVGEIYKTDIITIINGIIVPSYNIGGRTAIVLEDIGLYDKVISFPVYDMDKVIFQFHYTKVGFRTKWDSATRTISTRTARNVSKMVNVDLGDVELVEIMNVESFPVNSDLYGYIGSGMIMGVANPNNEYSRQNPDRIDYNFGMINTFTIDYITPTFSVESFEVHYIDKYYEVKTLFGFADIDYTFVDGMLDITTPDKSQNLSVPLKVESTNVYNSWYVQSPVYSIKCQITIDGNTVEMPDDIHVLISDNYGYVCINVKALEIIEDILGVEILIPLE
jgi:hypothetical protein